MSSLNPKVIDYTEKMLDSKEQQLHKYSKILSKTFKNKQIQNAKFGFQRFQRLHTFLPVIELSRSIQFMFVHL
jgi:hypothetical protein